MKRQASLSALVVVLLVVAFSGSAISAGDDRSAATKAVWDRHVQAAVAGDIDAVMADFTEDSAIITPDGVIAGRPAIRKFFVAFLAAAEEAGGSPMVNFEIVHDNIVVFNFTDAAKESTYHDTAVIADGKIEIISTIGYPAE